MGCLNNDVYKRGYLMKLNLMSLLSKYRQFYLRIPKESKTAFWEHTMPNIVRRSLAIHIFSLLFLATGIATILSVIHGGDGGVTPELADRANIVILIIAFIISGATSLLILLLWKTPTRKWLDTLLFVSAILLMVTRGLCASYELYVNAQYFRIILYWVLFAVLINYSPLRGAIVLISGVVAFYIGNFLFEIYNLPFYSTTSAETIKEIIKGLPIGINLILVGIVCYLTIDMNYKKSYKDFQITQQLNTANAQLLETSVKDALTSLNNRRAVDEYASGIWQECHANGGILSVMMFDADYFKAYNDNFGHQAGDDVLRLIADVLKRNFSLMRGMLARYGGEEFIAVIPYMEESEVMSAAECIRSEIEALGIANPIPSNRENVLTLSVGVHSARAKETESIDACIKFADDALYLAKSQGRNTVVGTMQPAP